MIVKLGRRVWKIKSFYSMDKVLPIVKTDLMTNQYETVISDSAFITTTNLQDYVP